MLPLMHHLHPTRPARLGVYAFFALFLAWQASQVIDQDLPIAWLTVLMLAVSIALALAALWYSNSTSAPLTAVPPLTGPQALKGFFIAAWLAPFHYAVFYFALAVLALMVLIPVNLFHLTDWWSVGLVLLALGGCFGLEYVFLYLLRAAADNLPDAVLTLPKEPPSELAAHS
jgi:hypothetical protein